MKGDIPDLAERVLLLAGARDGHLARQLLDRSSSCVCICKSLARLVGELRRGAGVLLLAQESLAEGAEPLIEELASQPTWSDLPVIIITRHGTALSAQDVKALGNVVVIERPVRLQSLESTILSALRSRARQYQARRALENRDRFLAMLGHELRNPLAAVSLAAQQLAKQQSSRTVDVLCRQSNALARLVDDILDVSRMSLGKVMLHRRVVDLRGLAAHQLEQARSSSSKHTLSIELPAEVVPIFADPVRIEQVLANLLSNAMRYSPDGGPIHLGLEVEGDKAALRVTDSGMGIAPDKLEEIFEMFAQLEAHPERQRGGLGIGLHLVKTLVEQHGGCVAATSLGLGKGACFEVRLPLAKEQPPDKQTTLAAAMQRGGKVLVVDDVEDVRDTLAEALRELGYTVTTAAYGEQALREVQRQDFDAAVLDVGLPDIDGYSLAHKLRAAGCRCRLIALTGFGQVRDRERALAAGFNVHLTKPVDLNRLEQAIAADVAPA